MTEQVNTEKKQNAWIEHLKQWSIQNKIPYASAISDPQCKEAYKKSPTETNVSKKRKVKKPKDTVEPETVLELKTEVVEKKQNKKKKKKKPKEVPEVAVAVEEE